jgi:hypothetical protein
MQQVPPKHTRKTDIHCPENFKSHTEHFHFPLYVYFQIVIYHIGYHEVHQRLMHRHSGGTMTATHGLTKQSQWHGKHCSMTLRLCNSGTCMQKRKTNLRRRERTNKMQLIRCLLSNFLSQHVSGIIMPIIRRIRPCPTACGVLPGCVGCGWLWSCTAACHALVASCWFSLSTLCSRCTVTRTKN